jgi:peptidylamidoglycolate lyase
MKRKEFIQNSSLLVAGTIMAREQLFDIVNGDVVYGQNEKKYKLDKNWVKADATTLPVNDCHEMIQDGKGRIVLLTNETKNNVIFFNKKGKPLQTWGHDFPGAHGLTIFGDKEQFFFITDTNKNQFYKTTIDGRILQTWDYPVDSGKYADPKRFVPTETTITKNGEIYVADGYGMQYITHYDAQGKIKNIFGGRGNEDKHLDNAHGITIDYRTSPETLIITDRTRCCFKRFSMSGDYMETISLPGACVCRPVIKGNYLYAAVLRSPNLDTVDSGFVIILNKENKVVSVIGGSVPVYENGKLKPFSQTEKLFKHPHDVMVDDEENLYVCQWSSGKVYPYKFKPVK